MLQTSMLFCLMIIVSIIAIGVCVVSIMGIVNMVIITFILSCLVSKFFLLLGRRAKKVRRMVAEVELVMRAKKQTTTRKTVCPTGRAIAGAWVKCVFIV